MTPAMLKPGSIFVGRTAMRNLWSVLLVAGLLAGGLLLFCAGRAGGRDELLVPRPGEVNVGLEVAIGRRT
jgi:hypothetical protein